MFAGIIMFPFLIEQQNELITFNRTAIKFDENESRLWVKKPAVANILTLEYNTSKYLFVEPGALFTSQLS